MVLASSALGMALASEAKAGIPAFGNLTCTAQYGEAYSWVLLELESVAPFEGAGAGKASTTATVSVPYGPRGAYITQVYIYKPMNKNREGSSVFRKRGRPTGPASGSWSSWFPAEIEVVGEAVDDLSLRFKGDTLALDCR
jgi:hypothetical protein